MNAPVISRATIQKMGAAAFKAKKSRNSHEMNPHAAALHDWLIGYDQAANEYHHGASANKRVDARQVAV